jgi:hypothetical protein
VNRYDTASLWFNKTSQVLAVVQHGVTAGQVPKDIEASVAVVRGLIERAIATAEDDPDYNSAYGLRPVQIALVARESPGNKKKLAVVIAGDGGVPATIMMQHGGLRLVIDYATRGYRKGVVRLVVVSLCEKGGASHLSANEEETALPIAAVIQKLKSGEFLAKYPGDGRLDIDLEINGDEQCAASDRCRPFCVQQDSGAHQRRRVA